MAQCPPHSGKACHPFDLHGDPSSFRKSPHAALLVIPSAVRTIRTSTPNRCPASTGNRLGPKSTIPPESGSALVLEVARELKARHPKRSVLFLATTAEEQGLLGAKYYVEHPLYPLARTLADLNMDGMNPLGRTRDVSVYGLGNIGQHVLDEVLKERDKINEALQTVVDAATEPWGVKVEMVEMKDVEIPIGMQRAMAQEAQAVREKRARIIKAEAEQESSAKLAEASKMITENPLALELRRMQMITEVGAEQNTTTIIMMPSEFVTMAEGLGKMFKAKLPAQEG